MKVGAFFIPCIMNIKLKKNRLLVWLKYDKKCAYCGIDIEYSNMQVDHIKPKQRGFTQSESIKYNIIKGGDNVENLNPSCNSCNSSKSTFSIESWRKELELKKKRIERDSSTFRILKRFGVIKIINKPITFYFESYE